MYRVINGSATADGLCGVLLLLLLLLVLMLC